MLKEEKVITKTTHFDFHIPNYLNVLRSFKHIKTYSNIKRCHFKKDIFYFKLVTNFISYIFI